MKQFIQGPYTLFTSEFGEVWIEVADNGDEHIICADLPANAEDLDEQQMRTGQLLATSWDYHSACQGTDPDVTRLRWASAFLTEIDGDEGVLGLALERSPDRQALCTAWTAICDLVRELQAAHVKAGGAA